MSKHAYLILFMFFAWISSAVSAWSDQADIIFGNTFTNKWDRGDLIFQELVGEEAEMLKMATGSRFTHVGILRTSGGGPVVLEATPEGGTFETDLSDFLERGVGMNYAIYRIKGLTPPDDWYHPLVLAASEYFQRPYDVFYRPGADALGSAELIIKSARDIGVNIGNYQRLGDLKVKNDIAKSYFLRHWRDNPDCTNAKLTREQCWSHMQKQMVVTPASLVSDDRLELIYATFEEENLQ